MRRERLIEPARRVFVLLAFVTTASLVPACSSDAHPTARSCPSDSVSFPVNPSFTPDQQAQAKALVEQSADVQRFAGTSQPTVTYQRPFITACADVLGTVEEVRIVQPPQAEVEMRSWRCIDDVTESGMYKVNLSGTEEFGVEVDLRTSTIVAFEPTVKFGEMQRVAAAPHPNEGLPCRAND